MSDIDTLIIDHHPGGLYQLPGCVNALLYQARGLPVF
jgi:hypothetical protein